MMDSYLVFSFWAFLAWYLPRLEDGKNHDSNDEPTKDMVMNLDRVYLQLGSVHESMAQYMRAVVNYKEAVRLNPRLDKAHFGVGKNYILAQRLEKAIKPLERALKLNPEETLASIYLGWVNSQLGHHEKAAEALKKALNFSAVCPSCGIKHHKNAALAAQAVIQIPTCTLENKSGVKTEAQPAHPAPAHVENAALLPSGPANDSDKSREEACPAEEQKLKIEFEGQNLIDTKLAVTLYRYGLAHIKLEEYVPAMTELREAVLLDPEFADAHFALGLVYERMGMQKESLAEYILALQDKPAFHEAKFKLEEEITLDDLKRILPDHFPQDESPPPKPHHHTLPAKVIPLRRPQSFKESVREEGWSGAIKKRIQRFY